MRLCHTIVAMVLAVCVCALAAGDQDRVTIGIMRFDVSANIEQDIADFCTEALTQNLALAGNFRVIDSRRVERTIASIMEEDQNMPEEDAAIEAIKRLELDQICRGSIRKLGDTTYIRVWRLDKTGAIVRAAEGTYTSLDEVEPTIREIAATIADRPPSSGASGQVTPLPDTPDPPSGAPTLTILRTEGETRSSYANFVDNRLTSEIVASGEYSIVPWSEVERNVEDAMSSDPSMSLREARSRALSALGVKRVLDTNVAEIGNAFHLSAQILDQSMRIERIAEESANNRDGLDNAVKELALKIVMTPEDYDELLAERRQQDRDRTQRQREADRQRQQEERRKAQEREEERQQFTNSIGMEFQLIKPGEFIMGSRDGEGERDERPFRVVNMTNEFYMGKTHVTQAQYEEVMRTNPSRLRGPNKPVEQVSWHDAQEFVLRLSHMDGDADYRLTTEAEWEYACRAGSLTHYFWGDEFDGDYAWYQGNSRQTSHDVGLKEPNPWGLYDMVGNVWEWCQDWYAEDYAGAPTRNPTGPRSGRYRVVRGGSWVNGPEVLRSANRRASLPTYKHAVIGFRVVAER